MANKSKWRMAFDKSKFTLEYNEPIRIVHCAWISDPESSSLLPFLIYRIIITGLFLAVLGWSWHIFWDSGKWFIFLTNWGFLMCGLQSLIGTLLVIVAYWKQKTVNIIDSIFDLSHDDTKMPISYKIYWIFYNIAITVAFFITLLYWTILYSPDESKESDGPFGLNLATHAGNSILCALDLIICGIPSQFLHVIHPLLFLLLYTIFNLVYWATGGLGPDGETYIYPVLDWDNNPGLGVGIIFGGAALLFVLHAFVCFIAELRTMLTLKIWRRSENNIMISTRPVLSEGSSNKGFVI